jgi:dethiobiotin synthetase
MSVVIAGIHTGIGKTVCSAIICQATGCDYLKPVQAGDLENTDSLFVRQNVSNESCFVHPEIYKLKLAASPHYAAQLEGIEIEKNKMVLPAIKKNILIETAGGIMSPLAKNFLNLDLIEYLAIPVVLVSNSYLGSINHTLMSYMALTSRNIKLAGIVFNGEKNLASEQYILEYTQLPLLFSIPTFKILNKEAIQDFAKGVTITI